MEHISHVEFPLPPPPPPKVPCRYCQNTFIPIQGRALHEAALHTARLRGKIQPARGETNGGGDLRKPWAGIGLGRFWVVRFTNIAKGGRSGSGPNSPAEFILKPRIYVCTNLNNDGFSTSQPKQTRGAEKRVRYTFRQKANITENLRHLETRKDEIYNVELLTPRQYLAEHSKIDTSLTSK